MYIFSVNISEGSRLICSYSQIQYPRVTLYVTLSAVICKEIEKRMYSWKRNSRSSDIVIFLIQNVCGHHVHIEPFTRSVCPQITQELFMSAFASGIEFISPENDMEVKYHSILPVEAKLVIKRFQND